MKDLYHLSLIILLLFFFGGSNLYGFNIEDHAIQRVRVSFVSPEGNVRPLLLGFTPDDSATDGVDYGYDAKNNTNYPNDLNWIINGERYLIQGVGRFEDYKFYEFGLWLEEVGDFYIVLTDLENFHSEISVYIYDAVMDDYTQINDTPFQRQVEPGAYLNRFFLAFSVDSVTLSDDENTLAESTKIYTEDGGETLSIKSRSLNLDKVSLYSVDGKMVYNSNRPNSNYLKIPYSRYKSVPVLIRIKAENKVLSKLILIN